MLVNAVIYEFEPERVGEIRRLLTMLRDASLLEPGCHGFDVNQSNDTPHVFVLYERWEDQAALDRHYASEHFQRLGANGIRPLAKARIAHLCTPLST